MTDRDTMQQAVEVSAIFHRGQKMFAVPVQPAPPPWWSAVENILKEYGLQAIDFVADFKQALAQPAQQEPVLQDIEQYRLQMAGICTAALGYWKEGDGIGPDYDTQALRDDMTSFIRQHIASR